MLEGKNNEVRVSATVGKAFTKMQQAAAKDGIILLPTSGIRDSAQQQKLFKRVSDLVQKYAGKPYINPKTDRMDQAAFTKAAAAYKKATGKTLMKAGRPGRSTHEEGVGQAIDISRFSGDDYSTPAALNWLRKNAKKYGFNQPNWARVDDPVHWEYTG